MIIMKIKKKKTYFFHKNVSCEDYPFESLSHSEIESFINENIVFKYERFHYGDFIIPSYWYNNSPRCNNLYIYFQTGVNKCSTLNFSNPNSSFQFVHDLEYNADNLKMMILYKK